MKKLNLKFAAQQMTKEQMKNVKGGESPTCSCGAAVECWEGSDDSFAGYVIFVGESCRDVSPQDQTVACIASYGAADPDGCECLTGC